MAGRLRTLLSSRTGIILGLLILLPILHYTRILRPVENLVMRALQPAETALYEATTSAVDGAAEEGAYESMSQEELVQTAIALEDQIDNLTVENAYLKTLVDETQLLESQLSFLEERSFQAVNARVGSRSTDTISQSIVINKGSVDGLENGLPVIIENGILIGTVQDVEDYSATVLLTTSFDSRVSAAVQNKAQSAGIVRGSHNLSLLMEFIPQFDNIAVDHSVFTNGTDEKIPAGLVIGRVQEVVNQPGSLFQEASLEPLYRPSEITVVSVILP